MAPKNATFGRFATRWYIYEQESCNGGTGFTDGDSKPRNGSESWIDDARVEQKLRMAQVERKN